MFEGLIERNETGAFEVAAAISVINFSQWHCHAIPRLKRAVGRIKVMILTRRRISQGEVVNALCMVSMVHEIINFFII